MIMPPIIKTTPAIIWSVVSFIFCKWIAMIFFIMAYDKYESSHSCLVLQNQETALLEYKTAEHYMRIGIIIFIICLIIEIIVSTIVVIAFANLLFM